MAGRCVTAGKVTRQGGKVVQGVFQTNIQVKKRSIAYVAITMMTNAHMRVTINKETLSGGTHAPAVS
jgi:hypothetical protein